MILFGWYSEWRKNKFNKRRFFNPSKFNFKELSDLTLYSGMRNNPRWTSILIDLRNLPEWK